MLAVSQKEFMNDMTNIIRPAIERGMDLSHVADVICEFTKMSRESAMKIIAIVGVQMNMELGYSYQEALKGFFGK